VLCDRRSAKVAWNVLLGALERDPETAAVPVDLAHGPAAVADAARARRDAGQRVLVGWSGYSPERAWLREALAEVRARASGPAMTHVLGGVHASAEPAQALEDGWDLAFAGEGERGVVELVRALARGEDPGAVRGVWSRGPDGALRPGGRAEPVDLEAWPPFAPGRRRYGPIELTRGCIYACGFCQTPFQQRARFRHRSLEDVARWVAHLVQVGFGDYRFLSPTALSYGADGPEPRLERVEALLRAVRELVGPRARIFYGTFPSEVRPEHVTPEAMQLLRRWVDNRTLIIGGQSGSERVLQATHRGHDVASIGRAVDVALAAGFVPHVDFLFGLPGEEDEDRRASLALMSDLAARGARVHGHSFMPLPGTPLRDAPPGSVPPWLDLELERLASRGALYGQWKTQVRLAASLAEGRPPRRLPVAPARGGA
jgi:B12-binding domain/radical SAM domain protein